MNEDIILLVDVDEWEEPATFGTCELCTHEGIASYQDLIFQQGNERFRVNMWEWSWGDLFEMDIPESNIIPFAEYIKDLELTDREYLDSHIRNLYYDFLLDNPEYDIY